jgi:hypothetical protein
MNHHDKATIERMQTANARRVFMVNVNCAGSVFVKELDFFTRQGGFREKWGEAWEPVVATSIEDAREVGCKKFPLARPYERQAK